jgi:hypothetical protein
MIITTSQSAAPHSTTVSSPEMNVVAIDVIGATHETHVVAHIGSSTVIEASVILFDHKGKLSRKQTAYFVWRRRKIVNDLP